MNRQELQNSTTDYDQRVLVKFGVLLNWSARDTHNMLRKALDGSQHSYESVRRLTKSIKEGRVDIKDIRGGAHHIHPESDERVNQIKDELSQHRGWSVRHIAEKLGIPKTTVHEILTEKLGLKKVMKVWVPHTLTEDQKIFRIEGCHNNLLRYRRHPSLLKRTLAIDESWVSLLIPESKTKAKVWIGPNENVPTTIRAELREPKRMLILAMDFEGIAFWEILPLGTTVNAQVYLDFLQRNIPEWMARKGHKKVIIAQDNARPHVARIINEYFAEQNIEKWVQAPYSPDLQPCDFNGFGPLKEGIRGYRHSNWTELTEAIKDTFERGLGRGLFKGVSMLPDRWERVITEEGEYLTHN